MIDQKYLPIFIKYNSIKYKCVCVRGGGDNRDSKTVLNLESGDTIGRIKRNAKCIIKLATSIIQLMLSI